jgi:hypothetical protein
LISMAVSPDCTKLYRTARRAVILAAIGLMAAQLVAAQVSSRDKKNKGPRALGLVELASSGKAHLVPIAILIDGEFYDAGAYKAAPVPMALESGTVYEAVRTGISQGLFTVSGALEANNNWIAEGTWQSASALAAAAAAAAKKKGAQSKPAPEPVEGPPVLRRANSAKPAEPSSAPPAESKPEAKSSAPAPPASAPAAPEAPAPAASAAPASASGPAVSEEDDPNRPVLKRGAPSPAEVKKRNTPGPSPAKVAAQTPAEAHKPSTPASSASGSMQLIPAISDADGPDPRPYAFTLKPDEEQKLRKKILALAGDEVRARAAQLAADSQPTPHTPASGTKAKPPQPNFEDVQFHAFDLSNSNEPVLVVTAKARMPVRPDASGADTQYIITLVTRDDMYGELHKVFSSITDTQHFDVLARMELIDAVDADGDGRGELLFRQVSDAGSAFILYRVIGDRLWPLFQGTPGQ